jgi:glutamate synthase (NADPH/NADH) small chain
MTDELSRDQASRCMDCGTPFCHWGCPIGNYIPEWNDLVFNAQWERAFELLDATNNMPEVTGRVCPATCEYACVLGINDDPVTIRENELAVIEHAFKKGWVRPKPPKKRSGKKVAVIGSGPAGLACAAQLNKSGHKVVVFERDDRIGGILRYGIPDFKLEKRVLDRRIDIWKKEGIKFKTKTNVGVDYPLSKEFDAVCLAGGSRVPRDLKIPGRELKGIYFAMDYLTQSNRRIAGEKIPKDQLIDAKGKKVVVIGGGDTGADCVGTANRQGAACVVQIDLLPQPPECRDSHEEGAERQWSILTKKFVGKNGKVKKLSCVRLKPDMKEIPGSEFEIEADLVILAIGFLRPEHNGLLSSLGVEFDNRGNVKTDINYMTSVNKVFSAGDMRRGQSLVVWAIYEGRQAAKAIDKYLRGA